MLFQPFGKRQGIFWHISVSQQVEFPERKPKRPISSIASCARKDTRVFAANPNATIVEGDICYPRLQAIPEKPGGVVMITKPPVTDQIVKDFAALRIKNV